MFNFFRPGYVPPNTAIAAAGLVAPEFQITDETSVAGYINFMQAAISSGVGVSREVRAAYAGELAVADNADALIDRVNRCLMAGTLGDAAAAGDPRCGQRDRRDGTQRAQPIASTPQCC